MMSELPNFVTLERMQQELNCQEFESPFLLENNVSVLMSTNNDRHGTPGAALASELNNFNMLSAAAISIKNRERVGSYKPSILNFSEDEDSMCENIAMDNENSMPGQTPIKRSDSRDGGEKLGLSEEGSQARLALGDLTNVSTLAGGSGSEKDMGIEDATVGLAECASRKRGPKKNLRSLLRKSKTTKPELSPPLVLPVSPFCAQSDDSFNLSIEALEDASPEALPLPSAIETLITGEMGSNVFGVSPSPSNIREPVVSRKRRSPAVAPSPNRGSKRKCEPIVPGSSSTNEKRTLFPEHSKVLPCLPLGREQCCITGSVLADVLDGKYNSFVNKVTIIDCRYPFEYEGGHIVGALNLWTQDRVYDHFFGFKNVNESNKPDLLILHCEFSKERGPKMWSFIRREDRFLNKYPNLFFPETYVLEGGYKSFYGCEEFRRFCVPQDYILMVDRRFITQYNEARSEAKKRERENNRLRSKTAKI